jgi:predicted nucleic acid-binding protein
MQSGRFGSPWTVGRLVFDTNGFIWKEKGREAILELEKLREQFVVEIVKTDVVDSELSEKYNVRVGDEFDITTSYVELNGIFYLDESRINHAVMGTDEEAMEVQAIARVLKPGVELFGSNDFRDARHLATAKKYGCLAFVTADGNILKRAPELLESFQIRVLTPEDALELVQELVRRRDLHAAK